MGAATDTQPRIAALDTIRGVAVMGILAMNIVAFSMPFAAYTNPAAWGGDSGADLAAWTLSFVFVDGKMRGLFTFLFGASMLLVIDRAEAAGEPPERVHFRRMGWLLMFGLGHFYLIWWGDILSLYAPAGMIAWFFWTKSARALTIWGCALIAAQFLLFAALAKLYVDAGAAASAPGAGPAAIAEWRALEAEYAPSAAEVARELAAHTGGYSAALQFRLSDYLWDPATSFIFFGFETVGIILLGMAALRTGFLTGAWSDAAYRRVAGWGLGITLPLYAAMAFAIWRSGFDARALVALSLTATIPLRAVTVAAYAALIILLTRGGSALGGRIAAAGRAAFTNYLATSIVMTWLFYGYGLGLYGQLGRAELWLVLIPAWALMLLWSKPWLDRYRYGPLEWLWRSLARGRVQPLRR